jgi:hypothetical protein
LLSNEALHLAGAILFVGFKASVGTLWSISDSDGPVFCAEFYRVLLEGGETGAVDYSRVGLAVYCAVRKLRDAGVELFRWVPFVHVGM